LVSCKQVPKTSYEKLEQFCINHSTLKDLKDYNSVVVINDKTQCLNCTNMFAKSMAKRLDKNEKILFIISDNGARVDISNYIDKKRKNVIFDYQNDFDKLGIANGSAFIDLKNRKIIATTVINAQNVRDFK
jgi:hypothetical protein